jgi:hypothetical protein
MKYNLDGKKFKSISNTENGEVSAETIFHYHQNNEIITADYSGGSIRKGHLIGKQLMSGQLEFVYHHINDNGELMVGKCSSTPEISENNKIKLIEKWQWLSGDKSQGESEIIEI